jgi:hypothetical protein
MTLYNYDRRSATRQYRKVLKEFAGREETFSLIFHSAEIERYQSETIQTGH